MLSEEASLEQRAVPRAAAAIDTTTMALAGALLSIDETPWGMEKFAEEKPIATRCQARLSSARFPESRRAM
jgi:hypothetical protein